LTGSLNYRRFAGITFLFVIILWLSLFGEGPVKPGPYLMMGETQIAALFQVSNLLSNASPETGGAVKFAFRANLLQVPSQHGLVYLRQTRPV